LLIVVSIFATAGIALATSPNKNLLGITGRAIQVFEDSDTDSSVEVSQIIPDVTPADIAEVQKELQEETDVDERGFATANIVYGQGWFVGNNKGALVNLISLEQTFLEKDGSTIKTASHGRLKIGNLNLKIQKIESSPSTNVFSVSGPNIQGTLTLNLQNKYGEISIWKGQLSVQEIAGADTSVAGEITLAMKESKVRPQKIEEYKEKSYYTWSGDMKLDQLSFKLQGQSNIGENEVKLKVYGENNVRGKMTLEVANKGADGIILWRGEIKIEEIGDDDDKIEGNVEAKIPLKGGDGKITIFQKDGSKIEGTINLVKQGVSTAESVKVKQSEESKFKTGYEDTEEKFKFEDESESELKDKSGKSSDAGFWKKVKAILGID